MIFENRVLACVDQSHFADYVADYAAWAAKRMDAPLELLHTIERHPELGSGADIRRRPNGGCTFRAQDQ